MHNIKPVSHPADACGNAHTVTWFTSISCLWTKASSSNHYLKRFIKIHEDCLGAKSWHMALFHFEPAFLLYFFLAFIFTWYWFLVQKDGGSEEDTRPITCTSSGARATSASGKPLATNWEGGNSNITVGPPEPSWLSHRPTNAATGQHEQGSDPELRDGVRSHPTTSPTVMACSKGHVINMYQIHQMVKKK